MLIIEEVIILVALVFTIFWLCCLIYAQALGAPTVYSNREAIISALKLAGLKKGELLVDLGCGDARSLIIAAEKYQAKGIGIERSPFCYLKSKINVYLAGQNKNIKIFFGDLKMTDHLIAQADVIYLYLLNIVLENIEDDLFANSKKGARIVSLAFVFKKHKPKKMIEVKNLGRKTKVRLYTK